MPKMKIALVTKPGADFELQERDIPQPPAGQVRIRVQACGICLSDHLVKDGLWPGVTYPRSPGHEVAGIIDEVGSGVTIWKKGQRVGVGWHGGQDGTCLACRRGDFANCTNLKVSGISFDGGYGEYMVAPGEAVAAMPESLDAAEAAPLPPLEARPVLNRDHWGGKSARRNIHQLKKGLETMHRAERCRCSEPCARGADIKDVGFILADLLNFLAGVIGLNHERCFCRLGGLEG